nr:MAG TPA: hypothetical protein [Inoviridae sp.]
MFTSTSINIKQPHFLFSGSAPHWVYHHRSFLLNAFVLQFRVYIL